MICWTLPTTTFVFSPFAYAYISITETDKRTDYEGKEIAEQIEEVWNKKYKEYLGVEVDSPANGFLQDVHWSFGLFGYHYRRIDHI